MAVRSAAGLLVLLVLLVTAPQLPSAGAVHADRAYTELSRAVPAHAAGAPCVADHDAHDVCCMAGQCHGIAGLPAMSAVGAHRAVIEATLYTGTRALPHAGCPIEPTSPPPRTEV